MLYSDLDKFVSKNNSDFNTKLIVLFKENFPKLFDYLVDYNPKSLVKYTEKAVDVEFTEFINMEAYESRKDLDIGKVRRRNVKVCKNASKKNKTDNTRLSQFRNSIISKLFRSKRWLSQDDMKKHDASLVNAQGIPETIYLSPAHTKHMLSSTNSDNNNRHSCSDLVCRRSSTFCVHASPPIKHKDRSSPMLQYRISMSTIHTDDHNPHPESLVRSPSCSLSRINQKHNITDPNSVTSPLSVITSSPSTTQYNSRMHKKLSKSQQAICQQQATMSHSTPCKKNAGSKKKNILSCSLFKKRTKSQDKLPTIPKSQTIDSDVFQNQNTLYSNKTKSLPRGQTAQLTANQYLDNPSQNPHHRNTPPTLSNQHSNMSDRSVTLPNLKSSQLELNNSIIQQHNRELFSFDLVKDYLNRSDNSLSHSKPHIATVTSNNDLKQHQSTYMTTTAPSSMQPQQTMRMSSSTSLHQIQYHHHHQQQQQQQQQQQTSSLYINHYQFQNYQHEGTKSFRIIQNQQLPPNNNNALNNSGTGSAISEIQRSVSGSSNAQTNIVSDCSLKRQISAPQQTTAQIMQQQAPPPLPPRPQRASPSPLMYVGRSSPSCSSSTCNHGSQEIAPSLTGSGNQVGGATIDFWTRPLHEKRRACQRRLYDNQYGCQEALLRSLSPPQQQQQQHVCSNNANNSSCRHSPSPSLSSHSSRITNSGNIPIYESHHSNSYRLDMIPEPRDVAVQDEKFIHRSNSLYCTFTSHSTNAQPIYQKHSQANNNNSSVTNTCCESNYLDTTTNTNDISSTNPQVPQRKKTLSESNNTQTETPSKTSIGSVTDLTSNPTDNSPNNKNSCNLGNNRDNKSIRSLASTTTTGDLVLTRTPTPPDLFSTNQKKEKDNSDILLDDDYVKLKNDLPSQDNISKLPLGNVNLIYTSDDDSDEGVVDYEVPPMNELLFNSTSQFPTTIAPQQPSPLITSLVPPPPPPPPLRTDSVMRSQQLSSNNTTNKNSVAKLKEMNNTASNQSKTEHVTKKLQNDYSDWIERLPYKPDQFTELLRNRKMSLHQQPSLDEQNLNKTVEESLTKIQFDRKCVKSWNLKLQKQYHDNPDTEQDKDQVDNDDNRGTHQGQLKRAVSYDTDMSQSTYQPFLDNDDDDDATELHENNTLLSNGGDETETELTNTEIQKILKLTNSRNNQTPLAPSPWQHIQQALEISKNAQITCETPSSIANTTLLKKYSHLYSLKSGNVTNNKATPSSPLAAGLVASSSMESLSTTSFSINKQSQNNSAYKNRHNKKSSSSITSRDKRKSAPNPSSNDVDNKVHNQHQINNSTHNNNNVTYYPIL